MAGGSASPGAGTKTTPCAVHSGTNSSAAAIAGWKKMGTTNCPSMPTTASQAISPTLFLIQFLFIDPHLFTPAVHVVAPRARPKSYKRIRHTAAGKGNPGDSKCQVRDAGVHASTCAAWAWPEESGAWTEARVHWPQGRGFRRVAAPPPRIPDRPLPPTCAFPIP